AELIREISPLFHADKIKAPLIVFQGANDIRCKKPEADQIVRALRAKGIDVPILAGIIPVTGFAHTKRICDLCDAGIPAELERAMLATEGDPEAEFNLGVAYAAQQSAELVAMGAPGIHFYALNKAPATRAVLGALRAARPWRGARGQTPRA
ncbi:MAG: methylenetetrahydrofolate reductase, partial [Acidobacteriota bacterium]